MVGANARKRVMALTCIMAVGILSGCTTGRLQQERDALWAQNQELQSDNDRLRAANDALVAENDELSLTRVPAPAMDGAAASTNTGFDRIAGVETFETAGTITVRVPGDVLFSSGRVALKSTAKSTLSQIASVIRSDYPDKTIRIEGYTDTDPIKKSKWKDNLELSLQRAAAVHRYLVKQGIGTDTMYAAGFGKSRPGSTKAKSRRVEIAVMMQE